MMFPVRRLALCGLALVIAPGPFTFAKQSARWAQFRGPAAEQATVPSDFPMGDFGLRVSWTRDLGSGYSNVWIGGDRAVTMFTAGEVDVVAAFAMSTGDELWRYELGQKYAGHDGSDDGPLGTPTVVDGLVYALGPQGQLVSLSLADGSENWRRNLTEEDSTIPPYGYTTSPLVAGKHVIVATGGQGHAVTAFDRATGEPRWTSGDDSVSYQTPMLVELGGRQQLLTITDRFLLGLDPEGGKILWQLRHTEAEQTEQSGHPTVLDGERFLVKYGGGARLYRYSDGGVKEVWQTRAFGNTYALPVLRGGHFYGFTGTVFTCASAETGEIVWRSRELAGRGLADMGGTVAVLSLQGDLVLVDPSPEGYREITRVPVLEAGNFAIPSFGDGQFVVRNLEQLAAVRVDSSLTPQAVRLEQQDRLLGDFGKWVAATEALPESKRQGAVEERFVGLQTGPVFGDGGRVHLVWRGEAQDVAVTGDLFDGGQELALHKVAGTDLFFRSFQLDPKANYNYSLIVDYGTPIPDLGNPHSVDNGFVVASELRMPDWPASPHLEPPAADAPRGKLDSFPFRSDILDNTREIQVWRPADYGQNPDTRYPLLVVNHGDNVLRGGLMRNTLDNLVGSSVAPVIAVFVPRASGAEYGGPAGEDYTRFLVEELLPHLDRHYLTDPAQRAIMGPASAGVAAVYVALARPDVFQKAASQSFYPIEPAQGRFPEMIAAADPKPELVYVVWSRHDYDLGGGRRADEASRELLRLLRDAGVNVTEQIADYLPGWGGWRGQDDEILTALFPLPATKE